MALSTEKIEAIRERTDILRVIGRVVDLKKRGGRWLGLCPFHNEKTPSFSVSPDKGLYYCFGCHAGGDVFSFSMRHGGLDFGAAVRDLATEAGVEVEAESPELVKRRKVENDVARVNAYAVAFFEHSLWNPSGGPARDYLRQRGISEALARERQLGFGGAPGELLNYLRAKKVPIEEAGTAGLLTEDNERSLFEGRLIFPIRDAFDRVAGFGGRSLLQDRGPKYVNTRESPLFSKRTLLYGWKFSREAVRRSGRAVLVEGYMDVLACRAGGVEGAVAGLGTAFTEEHAKLLSRFAKAVVVMYDGDNAGQRASRGATETLVASKMKTLLAALPAGEDPDSFQQARGGNALREHVDAAVPAVEHFIDVAVMPDMSIEDRASAAEGLAPLIASLGSGLERDLYTARLAERVGVPVEQLQKRMQEATLREQAKTRGKRRARPGGEQTAGATPQSSQVSAGSSAAPPAATSPSPAELEMLTQLLLYAELRVRFSELSEYTSDPMRLLLDDLAQSDDALIDVLSRHLHPRAAREFAAIVPGQVDEDTKFDAVERTFDDILFSLKRRSLHSVIQDLRQEIQERESVGEDVEALLQRVKKLTRRMRELKGQRSTV